MAKRRKKRRSSGRREATAGTSSGGKEAAERKKKRRIRGKRRRTRGEARITKTRKGECRTARSAARKRTMRRMPSVRRIMGAKGRMDGGVASGGGRPDVVVSLWMPNMRGRRWSIAKVRKRLREQQALAEERHWEMLHEKTRAELWEEGMVEHEIWDPSQERVVLDERVCKMATWAKKLEEMLMWLDAWGEAEWSAWSGNLGSEFISLVRSCMVRHLRLRGVVEGREDWAEGFDAPEEEPRGRRVGVSRLRCGEGVAGGRLRGAEGAAGGRLRGAEGAAGGRAELRRGRCWRKARGGIAGCAEEAPTGRRRMRGRRRLGVKRRLRGGAG